MKRSSFVAALLCVAAFLQSAQAQDYPARTVKIIVPSAPGALTDAFARLLATRLQEKWGQPVIVENRAGAAGAIGTEAVYRAAPDGYTLLFTPQQALVQPRVLNPHRSFDPNAFEPIAAVTRSTVVLLAHPSVPVNDIPQLIAYAKANPGKLNFAMAGTGSTAHLSNELFFHMSGTRGTNVPYNGIAPATNALLSGQVDVLFDAMGNGLPNVRAGRLKMLGVATKERSPVTPDVAAISETLPGFLSTLWTSIVAPPKTPPAIVQKISSAVAEALRHPDFVNKLATLPGTIALGTTPAEMRAMLAEEQSRWAEVARITGMQAD